MRYFKRYVGLALCASLLLSSCGKDVQTNNETTIVENYQTTDKTESMGNVLVIDETIDIENNLASDETINDFVEYEDEREIYYRYIEDLLIPQYGLASLDYTYGIMQNPEDPAWYNPEGIVSAYIGDFDNDGKKELLVFYFKEEKLEELNNKLYSKFDLYATVYKLQNGIPQMLDEMQLYTYGKGQSRVPVSMDSNEFVEKNLFVSLITVENVKYIVIELSSDSYAFSDGSYCSYWGLDISGELIQLAFAFSQTSGGSSDFEYKGYRFDHGTMIFEELMYSEGMETEGGYDNFKTALESFFESNGIIVNYNNHCSSIFEENLYSHRMFSYQIDCKYEEEGKYKFTFYSTDYTDLRNFIFK